MAGETIHVIPCSNSLRGAGVLLTRNGERFYIPATELERTWQDIKQAHEDILLEKYCSGKYGRTTQRPNGE